jgi:hypothetical protein
MIDVPRLEILREVAAPEDSLARGRNAASTPPVHPGVACRSSDCRFMSAPSSAPAAASLRCHAWRPRELRLDRLTRLPDADCGVLGRSAYR